MRPPYISIFALLCTLVLSGCNGMPEFGKDPNGLASRVGNFSPVKLNAENAERKAAKLVTPLPRGTRDLDGRQENFDPTFGSPETEAEAAQMAAAESASSAKQKLDQEAQTPSGQSTALRPDSKDSSEFGKSQNGRTTVFMETPEKKPIIETRSPSASPNVSQGFGCPPAGVGSIQPMQQGGMRSMPQGAISSVPHGGMPHSAMPPGAVPPVAVHPGAEQQSAMHSGATQAGSVPQAPPGTRRRASAGVHPQVLSRQPAQLQSLATGTNPNRLSPQQQQVMLFRTPPQTPPERKNILMGQAPGATYEGPPAFAPNYEAAGMDSTDDLSLVTAQNQRARNVRVTVTARVRRLLPDDRKGNPHQRFLLGLSNGTTVLVAHNIDLAPYVPLQQGDTVTICGEYIWNEKGGVLHYTHHTTNSHHQGGYIQYNRQTYQ